MSTLRVLFIPMLALVYGHVAADGGSITAGGATYTTPPGHFASTPLADFTGVTGMNPPATDAVIEAGWWFRIEGDTAETFFPPPDSQSYVGSIATFPWNNVGARGFSATETLTISSLGANQGQVRSTMQVTNNGNIAITLHLFHATDIDVGGTSAPAMATLVGTNYIRINHTSPPNGQCEYRAPTATFYLVHSARSRAQ